jgi:nicotinate-nucleotide adenylyltransferase
MKIGILGGTFDPPHNGHLAVAEACLKELELDEIMFLPANQNPIKPANSTTAAKARLQMVRRLIEGQDRMSVSDMEITRGGKSYAVDSLEELQVAQPAEYWFIVGTDAAKSLPKWKNPNRLVKLCRIAIVTRPTTTESEILVRLPTLWKSDIDFVRMTPVDISSTLIRDNIAKGRDISRLTPKAVEDYVRENKLYA